MTKNILLVLTVITCVACGNITLTPDLGGDHGKINPPTGTINDATKLGNPNEPQPENLEKAIAGKLYLTSTPSEGSEFEVVRAITFNTDEETVSIVSELEDIVLEYIIEGNSITAEGDSIGIEVVKSDDVLDMNILTGDNKSKIVETTISKDDLSFDWRKATDMCIYSDNNCFDVDSKAVGNGMFFVAGYVQTGDDCWRTVHDFCNAEGTVMTEIECDDDPENTLRYKSTDFSCTCVNGKCIDKPTRIGVRKEDVCITNPEACEGMTKEKVVESNDEGPETNPGADDSTKNGTTGSDRPADEVDHERVGPGINE